MAKAKSKNIKDTKDPQKKNLSRKPKAQLDKKPNKRSNKKVSKGNKLLYSGLIVVVAVLFSVWYSFQPLHRQEKIQGIALDYLIDPIRSQYHVPDEVAYGLDWFCAQMPIMQKPTVYCDPFFKTGYRFFAYGGLPQSPVNYSILNNTGYIVGYDESKKNPAWVAFRLFNTDTEIVPPRPDHFSTDKRIAGPVLPSDYTGSGYDRGHMAPNYGIARCYGQKGQMESFLMSNIVPQRPDLNRGIWKFLEHREAKRFVCICREVWVVVGPIYYPEHADFIRNKIRIPDAFFNIVIDEIEGVGVRVLAFIMPQTATAKEPLKQYLTSVDTIEQLTGINFFSELPENIQAVLEATVPIRVW